MLQDRIGPPVFREIEQEVRKTMQKILAAVEETPLDIPDDFWEQPSLDRIPIPDDIERAIVTPHSHETASSPPLWLIWVRQRFGRGLAVDPDKLDFPTLDSIADSIASARAHYRMAI